MPRPGTIAADIEDYLMGRTDGASVGEIATALVRVRRSPVLRPSVRSAIYQHLDDEGESLFARVERGRYRLRRD